MCGGSAFLHSSVRWESGKTVAFRKDLTDANVFFREMAELECIKIRDNAFKDCHAEVTRTIGKNLGTFLMVINTRRLKLRKLFIWT